MTPQELKFSILNDAFTGKLCERIDSDDFGIKEIIVFSDQPFDIPETWTWSTLGSCCEMFTGNSIPESVKAMKYAGLKTGYDYIATKDVTFEQKICYDNGVKIPYDEGFKIAHKDAVLMCIEGGSAGRKIGVLDRDVCFGNKLCSFHVKGIDNRYLFYYLQSWLFKDLFSGNIAGIIGGVSIKKLKDIAIPIAPIDEQKRIVAKIEELLPLIDRYEKAWSELEEFNKRFPVDMQKSILQTAIQGKLVPQLPEEGTGEELYQQIQTEKQRLIKDGKIKKEKTLPEIAEDEIPFDIPESWKWARMGNIYNIHSSRRIHANEYVQDGVPFYRSLEVVSLAKGKEPSISYCISSQRYDELCVDNVMPRKGDLLITCIGGSIGWNWIVDNRTFYYKDGNVVAFDGHLYFDVRYLQSYLSSPLFKEQVKKDVSGTAYNALTIEMLKSYLIPVPPLAEQKRIVAKLEEILPLCEKLK